MTAEHAPESRRLTDEGMKQVIIAATGHEVEIEDVEDIDRALADASYALGYAAGLGVRTHDMSDAELAIREDQHRTDGDWMNRVLEEQDGIRLKAMAQGRAEAQEAASGLVAAAIERLQWLERQNCGELEEYAIWSNALEAYNKVVQHDRD